MCKTVRKQSINFTVNGFPRKNMTKKIIIRQNRNNHIVSEFFQGLFTKISHWNYII